MYPSSRLAPSRNSVVNVVGRYMEVTSSAPVFLFVWF